MDPTMNSQSVPPTTDSFDAYHSFGSNPPPSTQWQDSAPRFRGQSHYQGPYPTPNPRMRQHGDFQPRGRYPYNRRGGGYRPQNREKNFDQQEQSSNNSEYPATTMNPTNRSFNKFCRPTMLEDPWAHMKPQKVPSNGTSLVSNSTYQ